MTDLTYTFRYRVWNIHGWSPYSNTISILCSTWPAQPTSAPAVAVSDSINVLITWLKPDDGGNYISAYKIFIQKIDGSFSQELTNCDGSLSSTVTNWQCLIPMSVLWASPFNLVKDSNVIVKYSAINILGESDLSPESGTPYIKITTIPNTPSSSPIILSYS